MNWHHAIGLLSTAALSAPVFVMLAFRLINNKKYLPLFLYSFLALSYNLMTEGIISLPKNIERTIGITNNLTDIPLMFTFLIFQIAVSKYVRVMRLLLAVFIVFETAMVITNGITVKTITLVMGPGLILVFAYALLYFFNSVKKSFINTKFVSKAFIASSLCFAYGSFIILYLMHYIFELPDIPNIFLIYYIVTIIYCSLLTAGLIQEAKRKRKLKELLVTRQELIHFFADEKKPATSSKVTGEWKLN